MQNKVVPVRLKNYIETGQVDSQIHYFYVPNGPHDIHMVYNGTSSGLNNAVWAPNFGLPFVKHTIRSLIPGYCQCDLYIGEMLLNFLLNKELQRLSGVEIRHVCSTDPGDAAWEKSRVQMWE